MTRGPIHSSTSKALAWRMLQGVVIAAQLGAAALGRTRRVDVIIYKVDRLGDWLLAEPSIRRLVAATEARGGTPVVWASRESSPLRAWRPLPCAVESLAFEPRGWRARLSRTLSLIRLLAVYRAESLYCLRHAPDPIRDFMLRAVAAKNRHALTWRMFPGPLGAVPHEVQRHHWILGAANQAPADPRSLLPDLVTAAGNVTPRLTIAPFSSAPIKDVPDRFWTDVVSAFSAEPRAWELWVGPDQCARAESLAARILALAPAGTRVSVRSGSVAELAGAISAASLVLSVDTLAAHLAAAFDVPLVALLGGGQFGDFAPWSRSERQRWLSHPLPCFHCGWHCSRAQNDCLQLIAPSAVVAAMRALETRRPAPERLAPVPS
ncbi:glycosyltransferase family 9 protein [Horticoccus sp. 23ND18S-11]|uniref:glycosyltransferase family 9 protein n=1 Tax=Horticoccus sp. 23ND18S-11 TaxID=3391832 RepID=UPI0039C9C759